MKASTKAMAANLGLASALMSNAGMSVYLRWPLQWNDVDAILYLVTTLALIGLSLWRPPAMCHDCSVIVVIACAISFYYPLAFAWAPGHSPSLSIVNARLGLLVGSDLALISMGTSFGILPARRPVVSRGAFTIVRHPVYSLYMCGDAIVVACNPTGWNVVVAGVGIACLVKRAFAEERVFLGDAEYAAYANRVKWMFVPYVC
jgi:protein-S-isoprenylcysteine O-methyltransferase Ste14